MHTEGDGFRPKEATSGTSILKHVFGGVSVGTVCTQVCVNQMATLGVLLQAKSTYLFLKQGFVGGPRNSPVSSFSALRLQDGITTPDFFVFLLWDLGMECFQSKHFTEGAVLPRLALPGGFLQSDLRSKETSPEQRKSLV